jgi:hypothetical protein
MADDNKERGLADDGMDAIVEEAFDSGLVVGLKKPIVDTYFCGSASFGRRDGDTTPLEPVNLLMDMPDYKRKRLGLGYSSD